LPFAHKKEKNKKKTTGTARHFSIATIAGRVHMCPVVSILLGRRGENLDRAQVGQHERRGTVVPGMP